MSSGPPSINPAEDETPVAPDVSLTSDMAEEGPLESEMATALQSRSSGPSVAKATAGITALQGVKTVIGFVTQPLIAHKLGLKMEADAYTVAMDILQRIWLIFEKVVNPAFLPCFIAALKDHGEERAWRFASSAVWLTVLALFVVTPFAWWQMPGIVALYTQKSSPAQVILTINVARMLLVGLFFLGMSSLTYVILNGYKRFAMAALGDTLWKLGIMMGAVVVVGLHKRIAPGEVLYVLAFGYVIGSFLKLLPHLVALRSKWRMLRLFHVDLSDPLTQKMLALAVPLVFGIVVSECRGVYLQRLADDPLIKVDAARAAIKWSRTIGDNLIQIFPYALSIGIFPYLAELARSRDRQPFTDTMMGALRVCVFSFLPLTAILIALRFEVLRAVWESGKLTQADTVVMSWPFMAYTLGLTAFACEMILNQTFYSMTNAWMPTLMGLITTVVWIIIAQLGVGWGWGLLAIAGAESFSKTLKCLLMWIWLQPHLGKVIGKDNWWFLVKVGAGAVLAAAVAWKLGNILCPVSSHASHFKIRMLGGVAVSGTAGMIAFLIWCSVWRVSEASSVLKLGRKLLHRA